MAYSADLMVGAPKAFSLGKPATAAASAISANAGAANATTTYILNFEMDSPFGRGIRVDFSGVPGTNAVVRLIGEDYLGQPISRDYTGAAAATTTTPGGVIFWKRITAARMTVVASNAVNIQIGTTVVLGLPYKGNIAWQKEGNPPALTAVVLANRSLPDLTSPATITSNDPRGGLTTTLAPDGLREFIIGFEGDPFVDAAGNGGLHGIRQFFLG
jgi:hypothetical protein